MITFVETNHDLMLFCYQIYDNSTARYEPIYPKEPKKIEPLHHPKYKVEFAHLQDSNFGFAIIRKSTNRIL